MGTALTSYSSPISLLWVLCTPLGRPAFAISIRLHPGTKLGIAPNSHDSAQGTAAVLRTLLTPRGATAGASPSGSAEAKLLQFTAGFVTWKSKSEEFVSLQKCELSENQPQNQNANW